MEKQNQLISVVIPVYNQERYLDRCLKSVVNQTYPNLEIICADDGSQDRTKKILQKWAKKDSRVHVLELPHSGVSICRNRGIEASGGDYLLFVDSDDYIGKNMIEILYENILRLDADMCVCGYFECMKKAVKRHSFLPSGVYDTGDYLGYLIKSPFNSYFGGPICKLVKKTVFQNLDVRFEPEEILAEDFVFNMKALRHIHTIAAVDECLYYFRRYSEGSLSKQLHSWETAYRRGNCMLQETFITFRMQNVWKRYQKEMQNFYVVMLRFFISHMMGDSCLEEEERKRCFPEIMDICKKDMDFHVLYRNLDFKGKIIFFIYQHGLYHTAKFLYRKQ